MDEWMNEWMEEWMNECMNVYEWMSFLSLVRGMNKKFNEEWMSEWMNPKEWINEWMIPNWSSKLSPPTPRNELMN